MSHAVRQFAATLSLLGVSGLTDVRQLTFDEL